MTQLKIKSSCLSFLNEIIHSFMFITCAKYENISSRQWKRDSYAIHSLITAKISFDFTEIVKECWALHLISKGKVERIFFWIIFFPGLQPESGRKLLPPLGATINSNSDFWKLITRKFLLRFLNGFFNDLENFFCGLFEIWRGKLHCLGIELYF